MANHRIQPHFRSPLLWLGARVAMTLLTANAIVLAVPQEHDKERHKENKPDAARPEPKHEPKPESRRESRREAKPESRRGTKPESRRGTKPESRREPRPEPSASAHRPEPRPASPSPAGRVEERRIPERQVVRTRDGGEIHRTQSGAIREVHTPGGAVIRHSPSGVRQVEVVRPGGRIIIANATGHSGYVQRPLMSHGHTYVQRTFIVDGRPHAVLYRPWSHGGREYQVYMPHHYYRPGFYVWAYNPWRHPVHYAWGWQARPWYGYYGGYFTPYPTYASPAFWLADFMIAATLESAYLAQNASMNAAPVSYTAANAMTPEVKEAIAEEVRRQMEQAKADQAAARNGGQDSAPPPIFSRNGPKVFLVSSGLLAYAGNQECALVEGDVLQLTETPNLGTEWAEVKVLASRGSSCPKGSYVSVKTMDLQEMQNYMQASVDQGMAKLQADQGKNGIPALPAQAMGTVKASYTDDIQPDENAQSELSSAVKEANRSEQDIISQGGQEPAGSGGSISLGMTIAEVESALGRPKNTVDLGAKTIYVYKDLKITFLNGKVSDVQ
jgi:hypothetical protein